MRCGIITEEEDENPEQQNDLDQQIDNEGKLKIIDELNPSQNILDNINLEKFVSDFDHTYMDRSRPKGPDYIIIDDFTDYFGDFKDTLLQARKEAEDLTGELSRLTCGAEDEAHARCDFLMWLKNL